MFAIYLGLINAVSCEDPPWPPPPVVLPPVVLHDAITKSEKRIKKNIVIGFMFKFCQ